MQSNLDGGPRILVPEPLWAKILLQVLLGDVRGVCWGAVLHEDGLSWRPHLPDSGNDLRQDKILVDLADYAGALWEEDGGHELDIRGNRPNTMTLSGFFSSLMVLKSSSTAPTGSRNLSFWQLTCVLT